MKKMYKVIHTVYREVCSDLYYSKESRIINTYVVFVEESEVVKLIEDLNKKNCSRFPATDEEIKELRKRYENEQKEKIEEYRTCYNNQKEYNKHRISDYDGGCCGYIGGNCKQCIFRSLESEDVSMFGDTDELVYSTW